MCFFHLSKGASPKVRVLSMQLNRPQATQLAEALVRRSLNRWRCPAVPAGEGPGPQRPVGEMPEDLVEHFDSRWLGTGEYEASLASDLLDYTRGPAFHPRGRHPSAAASSHQSGFAWPFSCRESPEASAAFSVLA